MAAISKGRGKSRHGSKAAAQTDFGVSNDDFHIREQRRFQRRFWAVERWAWFGFAAILIAAALGLTGAGGYFSRSEYSFLNGEMHLPRIARWDAADSLTVYLNGDRATHRIMLEDSFFDYFEVEGIRPPPQNVLLVAGGQEMNFAIGERGPHRIVFDLRPKHPGSAVFRAKIDGALVEATSLVLP
jgi:hypothetical protein